MSNSIHKRVIVDIKDGTINLKKEFGIYLAPEENDMYKVHFIMPGPKDTPYENGLYHGMIRLNQNHPFSPPNIHIITPNGRFTAESYPFSKDSRGICTTFTAFHPETWSPVNNIEKVIKGLVSLMCDEPDVGNVGAEFTTVSQKKKFATSSINHVKNDHMANVLFPELIESLNNDTFEPFSENKPETKPVKKSKGKIENEDFESKEDTESEEAPVKRSKGKIVKNESEEAPVKKSKVKIVKNESEEAPVKKSKVKIVKEESEETPVKRSKGKIVKKKESEEAPVKKSKNSKKN